MSEELDEIRREVEDLRRVVLKLVSTVERQGMTVGQMTNGLTELETRVHRLESHVDPRHG